PLAHKIVVRCVAFVDREGHVDIDVAAIGEPPAYPFHQPAGAYAYSCKQRQQSVPVLGRTPVDAGFLWELPAKRLDLRVCNNRGARHSPDSTLCLWHTWPCRSITRTGSSSHFYERSANSPSTKFSLMRSLWRRRIRA